LQWEGSGSSIHLTFDDGPHPEITPYVLGLLKHHQQKATFFLIGENAIKYPEVVSQILSDGHSIGNHTQHHLKYHKNPLKAYLKDIDLCDENIPQTSLFRPPYGRIGLKGIRALKNRRIIMWTLLSGDFDTNLNINKAMHHLKKIRSGDIIVFHDSEKALPQLKQILPDFLGYLKDKNVNSAAL
jgi:peptidoglycan/xylan/chitin deacetylase (PgdA/CDA1 family)